MLGQLNFAGLDYIEVAINRLQTYEPAEGYYLAFSGGKDSMVIKALCDLAGVKYDSHYNVSSVDHPEVIYYMRRYHPDVKPEYPHYEDGTRATMWNLIPRKQMPPTRLARYCCEVLKESGGEGRFVVTGVRWAESSKRKRNRSGLELNSRKGKHLLDDPDNPANEVMARTCPTKGKHILNPIIDWNDQEVWEFIKGGGITRYIDEHIREPHILNFIQNNPVVYLAEDSQYKLIYCCLYDQGYKRLGCIGCPMSTRKKMELKRNPKYRAAYLRAFRRMITERNKIGKDLEDKGNWGTPEEVMNWWLEK